MSEQIQMDADNERNPVWYQMRITRRQLHLLKILCRCHLDYSTNKNAMDQTRRLLTCLERWPKPEIEQEKTEGTEK